MERNRTRTCKIAFIGTSSVGKTEMLKQFQRHSPGQHIALVTEVARDYFEERPMAENLRFTAGPQGEIQVMVLEREKEAQDSGAAIILCDRSVLDAVVYVRANGDKEGADTLLRRVKDWLPTYDQFFLLDPEDVSFQKDDIRKEDVETRNRIHETFLDFFNETGIPYELLSGTVEQRIKRVEEIIELKTSTKEGILVNGRIEGGVAESANIIPHQQKGLER